MAFRTCPPRLAGEVTVIWQMTVTRLGHPQKTLKVLKTFRVFRHSVCTPVHIRHISLDFLGYFMYTLDI